VNRRRVNAIRSRLARRERWYLVHTASCVNYGQGCYVRDGVIPNHYADECAFFDVAPRRVSVPRSLRPILGRWLP
jgi:hypothetical protein